MAWDDEHPARNPWLPPSGGPVTGDWQRGDGGQLAAHAPRNEIGAAWIELFVLALITQRRADHAEMAVQ